MWQPKEIIVNQKVRTDPLTRHIISQCPNVPVSYANSGKANHIVAASTILNNVNGKSMLDTIIAGKGVLNIAPASMDVVDTFEMPDDRMMCPHFERLKFASNGCFISAIGVTLNSHIAQHFRLLRFGHSRIS